MRTDEKMSTAGKKFWVDGIVPLDQNSESRQTRSKWRHWHLFTAMGLFVWSGCAGSGTRGSSGNQILAEQICAAVQELMNNERLGASLRQDLAQISMNRFVDDKDGSSFSFGGTWHYDAQRAVLANRGFWIGPEHTWYEIAVKDPHSINLRDIRKLREVRKRS